MARVRELKREIRSIKNIQHITKAMKMVAAAKLRRTQEAVEVSRPYARKLEEVMGRIAASAKDIPHPLLQQRKVDSAGIILLTSDRGLAGSYNTNVIKKAVQESVRLAPAKISYIAAGAIGRNYLRRHSKLIIAEFTGVDEIPVFKEALAIADLAVELFKNGTWDEVYLIYQQFISPIRQEPTSKRILPIPYQVADPAKREQAEYLYEPEPEQILEGLLPNYLNNMIFEILMEASASQSGAQMTAMDSATDNAGKMIDKLTLSYNRARQAAVTTQISEIIGGANAMNYANHER